MVTIARDALLADAAGAGLIATGVASLDTGSELSIGEVRRIACGAGLLPAVLGGDSLPVDLGRSSRLFTQNQRTALATVYDECAGQGCDRPYAWCELHHEKPWSEGGRTDLRDAVPVCGFHHRRLHDPRFQHVITADPGHPGRKRITFRHTSGGHP